MRKIFCIIFIFLFCSCILWAQDAIPEWIMIERGITAFEEGEFGEALEFFHDVQVTNSHSPETEYWIGKIFEKEGESALAELQFKKALDLSPYLYLPDNKYLIQYNLAQLYYNTLQIDELYNTYKAIIYEDPFYQDSNNLNRLNTMKGILNEDGLDRLLFLYRYKLTFAAEAHSLMGSLCLNRGEYNNSINYYLLSVVSILTQVFDNLRVYLPNYEFTTVNACLEEAARRPDLKKYILDSNLFEDIYFLAQAYYRISMEERRNTSSAFKNLMVILSNNTLSSLWGERALRQLENPFLEPLLFNQEN